MADHRRFPLWDAESSDNLDPEDLPLSPGLIARLREWATRFSATWNADDPTRSGFRTREEEARFIRDGGALHEELKRELSGKYWVQYWQPEEGWWFAPPAAEEIVFVFGWWQGGSSPVCTARAGSGDSPGTLATLIMDDGGVSMESTVSWLTEAINQLARIVAGEIDRYAWCRETFEATFHRDHAIACGIADENATELVRVGARDMHRVLTEWRSFIQMPPGSHQLEVRCSLRPAEDPP